MTADITRRRLLLGALACAMLCACGGPWSGMLSDTETEGEARAALELIAELPSWYRTRDRDPDQAFTADEVRTYVYTARTLRGFDPENVKAAYAAALAWAREQDWQTHRDVSADLYVLDRILFAVPARIPIEGARYFTDFGRPNFGMQYVRNPAKYAFPLYPVALDADGAVAGINPAWRGYPVAPYDAVASYEYLHETYGFRDPIRYFLDPPDGTEDAPR